MMTVYRTATWISDIYADYINGKREIAEINAQMTGTFYTEEDLNH